LRCSDLLLQGVSNVWVPVWQHGGYDASVVLLLQRKRQQQRRSARVRIDRSMIGEPTNFQHTGHIGSGDVDLGNSHLRAIQNQMQSKGGYETAFAV
ncbi:unnamed protein product, partial [Timema podura]|nr:unnamed protein product [Timema podura]